MMYRSCSGDIAHIMKEIVDVISNNIIFTVICYITFIRMYG